MMFANAGFGFSAYSPPASSSTSAAAQPPPLPLLHLHEHEHETAAPDNAIYHHLVIMSPGAETPLPNAVIQFGAQGDVRQPSLISEYDLGEEGDLFKAPEPIIEEPLLNLDPVAAAISMMSCGENGIDDPIKVSDMGLIEVLYECEKELMEKSAIEETISELMDVKIPMLPGELRASPSAGECSLQKSVSSGCINSAVRPNFLDFQGINFEAAFRLRRAYSHGDIHNLGANTPRLGNPRNVHTSCERLVTINGLKTEERKQKLSRYRRKKIKRDFSRKIKYACRKALVDSQPRVRGRFAKMNGGDRLKPRR